jgi:hypothetical protein
VAQLGTRDDDEALNRRLRRLGHAHGATRGNAAP